MIAMTRVAANSDVTMGGATLSKSSVMSGESSVTLWSVEDKPIKDRIVMSRWVTQLSN
jgi:hypothetical protein